MIRGKAGPDTPVPKAPHVAVVSASCVTIVLIQPQIAQNELLFFREGFAASSIGPSPVDPSAVDPSLLWLGSIGLPLLLEPLGIGKSAPD